MLLTVFLLHVGAELHGELLVGDVEGVGQLVLLKKQQSTLSGQPYDCMCIMTKTRRSVVRRNNGNAMIFARVPKEWSSKLAEDYSSPAVLALVNL